jgi:hypothetical protein
MVEIKLALLLFLSLHLMLCIHSIIAPSFISPIKIDNNMPRFFDDYSNTYLTHDSAAGRKQQRRGWKFRENFKVNK